MSTIRLGKVVQVTALTFKIKFGIRFRKIRLHVSSAEPCRGSNKTANNSYPNSGTRNVFLKNINQNKQKQSYYDRIKLLVGAVCSCQFRHDLNQMRFGISIFDQRKGSRKQINQILKQFLHQLHFYFL